MVISRELYEFIGVGEYCENCCIELESAVSKSTLYICAGGLNTFAMEGQIEMYAGAGSTNSEMYAGAGSTTDSEMYAGAGYTDSELYAGFVMEGCIQKLMKQLCIKNPAMCFKIHSSIQQQKKILIHRYSLRAASSYEQTNVCVFV